MLRLPLFRTRSAGALAVLMAAPAMLALAQQEARAQEVPPSEKLLPPAVYAYASIPDVVALRERAGKSSYGALFEDPALDPIKEQLRAKFEAKAGKVEEKLGVTVKELLAIPSGEVAFAVFEVPGQSVGIVAIIEHGENTETVATLLKKAEESLAKQGALREVVEFEGTEIITHKGAETEADAGSESDEVELDIEGDGDDASSDPPDFKGNVAWFQKAGYLVVGNNAASLEAVLARWDGMHDETFADSDVYNYIAEKARIDDRAPAIIWFADPMGGLQTAIASAPNLPPQAQMISTVLPILGLTSLKGIGGGFDLATSEYNSASNTFLYIEAPPSGDLGLLNVFRLLPGELSPPAWVSQEVTAYVGAHWDAAGAIEAVKRLMDTFKGPGAFDRLMEKAANVEGGPKIHPKKDLIDQLTGVIHLANYPIKASGRTAETKTPPAQPTVIALEVDDEAGIKDVLSRLAKTPSFPGETREFEGATLYQLPTGVEGQGPVVLTVANGSLMFSSDVKKLEAILRGTDIKPLTESGAYERVAGHIPDETLMIRYQDQRDQFETMYTMFRDGEIGEKFEGFDPSTLPPFEVIAKYMRPGGGYAVNDEHGALFVSFTLKEQAE